MLDEQFMAAVLGAFDAEAGAAETLPGILASACVQVLPVAGAGVSFTDDLRIPLGASDEMAVRAELLETTLGEGPCLAATASSEPVLADGPTMAASWPIFHRELLDQTPYRAIVSIPLRSRHNERFGALDLYSTDYQGLPASVVEQVVTAVADPMAAILFDTPTDSFEHSQSLPSWLSSSSVIERMTVWIAIGMLMEEGILTNAESLATLRGYAFTNDLTLDDLASQLVNQTLSPGALFAP